MFQKSQDLSVHYLRLHMSHVVAGIGNEICLDMGSFFFKTQQGLLMGIDLFVFTHREMGRTTFKTKKMRVRRI